MGFPKESWDEKLRANLGAADKDTSHISHRLSEKEKRGRRRSPRKKRQVDKPDSEEEFSDQDSLPEIDIADQNITPEAQKILDTFANKLLEQLEENVAKDVVVPPLSPTQSQPKKLFGKAPEKGKDDKVKVSVEAADDTAVLDPEESIEATQAHLAQSCPTSLSRCLSDDSNTASLPQIAAEKQEEMLDRISPEFPALQLSDDSETDNDEDNMDISEVDSSTERKVKSDESTTKAVSIKPSFTPRQPRRVALTTTARRSPLKNDSTKFELQHDANNLDKNRNEEAEHLLEADRLKRVEKIQKDKKDAVLINSRTSPRKRKGYKTPLKSGDKSKIKETFEDSSVSSNKVCESKEALTPPQKKQKVPENAEFDEGKELSLMFSPTKISNDVDVTSHDLSSDQVIVLNVSPSQLPGVSVNIERMPIPARIMSHDSPTKSISLPPTPDSPMPLGPSRSPTPTICKALGLQRSGSKHKESTKDLNKSWTQAIWGLENVSEKIAEENANSVVGVGDGQSDRKTRRGGREVRSQDKEWTSEDKRSKSNSRELENKKVDKDAHADLVLEQLRRNKPRSATRQRSESTDNSKQR